MGIPHFLAGGMAAVADPARAEPARPQAQAGGTPPTAGLPEPASVVSSVRAALFGMARSRPPGTPAQGRMVAAARPSPSARPALETHEIFR